MIPVKAINEASAFVLKIGLLTLPSTLEYRVDCETNHRPVENWAFVASPGLANSVTVPAGAAVIINDANKFEDRVITVTSDRGLTTQRQGQVKFRVKNLYGVT